MSTLPKTLYWPLELHPVNKRINEELRKLPNFQTNFRWSPKVWSFCPQQGKRYVWNWCSDTEILDRKLWVVNYVYAALWLSIYKFYIHIAENDRFRLGSALKSNHFSHWVWVLTCTMGIYSTACFCPSSKVMFPCTGVKSWLGTACLSWTSTRDDFTVRYDNNTRPNVPPSRMITNLNRMFGYRNLIIFRV